MRKLFQILFMVIKKIKEMKIYYMYMNFKIKFLFHNKIKISSIKRYINNLMLKMIRFLILEWN